MTVARRNFPGAKEPPHHRIEINLRDLNQLLFHGSVAFHEKDLDRDAEEFIESWVSEYHRNEPVQPVDSPGKIPGNRGRPHMARKPFNIILPTREAEPLGIQTTDEAGRLSLLIGLVFLGAALLRATLLVIRPSTLFAFLKKVMIAGTVAMWRPMEIYLTNGGRLRRREKILAKMSKMRVEVCRRT